MTVLLGVVVFFLILATLILVHEVGHFTFAKLFGVRVEEFGIGFPPRLKTWRRRGTLYSLNAIPLGGFVKMMGENGDDSEPDSFGSKAPWKRFIILIAGPTMNLLLALLIFYFAFLNGSPQGLTFVTRVAEGSPAAVAGLRAGDRIVAVDGKSVRYFDDLQSIVQRHLGERVVLRVERGGSTFATSLIPRTAPPPGEGAMGIELGRTVTVAYSPGRAAVKAAQSVGEMVQSLPAVLATVSHHGGSGVAGPIGIAHITTNVVQNEPQQGPASIFVLMALLSANLGVLNLLPIPALDGGRLVFVLISWVRRRNLDPQVEGLIHMVGMAVLLFLIVIVSYHDIVGWITGSSF